MVLWNTCLSWLTLHRWTLRLITLVTALVLSAIVVIHPSIEVKIPSAQILHAQGNAFWAPLQCVKKFGFKFQSDEILGSRSKFTVRENGKNLAAGRASLEEISFSGSGRYFFSGDVVYLSTSDNSNPQHNGRKYSVCGKIGLTSRASIICSAMLLFLLALSYAKMLGQGLLNLSRAVQPHFDSIRYALSGRLPLSEARRAKLISEYGSRHVPELDGIRGYACISVLFAHCLVSLIHPSAGSFAYFAKDASLSLLLAGVDLFFVLSGFLIGGILMDSRGKSHYFKVFWIRRAARILPVLWLLLGSYAAALIVRANFNLPQLDIWLLQKPMPPFWTYATFTQSIPMAVGATGGPRWVGITWSLAIEEQFYLFFPVVVYFLSRRSLFATVLAGIMLSPCLRSAFAHLFGNWRAPYVLMPSRVDGLMFGVLTAIIIRNRRALMNAIRFRWILDAIALVLLYQVTIGGQLVYLWQDTACGPFPPLKQSLLAMLFAIMILRVFLYKSNWFNKLWTTKALAGLGLISYGLYMYHQSINGLVHGFIWNQEPSITTMPQLIASVFIMSSAILVAILSYHFVEKPIRSRAQHFSEKFRAPAAPKQSLPKSNERAKPKIGAGV